MAKFAIAYPDRQFVQTVSAQIPWSHNIAILDKVKDSDQRVWYIQKTAENGWSHSVLIHQIVGVSEYQITSDLPIELEKQLPSVEDIQKYIQR